MYRLFLFLSTIQLVLQIETFAFEVLTLENLTKDSIIKKESATSDYISIYQKYISGIRGQECPMFPSCSYFGLKTFNDKNFFSAFAMTSDRLLRCGHDHRNYSLTLSENGFKNLDYPAYSATPLDLYYQSNSYYYAFSDTLDDDSSLIFIKKLINNQYYQEALLEIMRVEFKTNKFHLELFTNKIICLKSLEEYEKALFEYEVKCPEEFKNNFELTYQIAQIQFKLRNLDKAIEVSNIAYNSCQDSICKPKVILLLGLLYASKFEWDKSEKLYMELLNYYNYHKLGEANIVLTNRAQTLKSKNPALASVFSIIPGAGYAYAGHKQTALTAFLVNGLLAYATYTSFENKNYGIGILTGIFNFSFYIGNIYGANKSAKRYNENQKKTIINKLQFNTNF